MMWFKLAGMGMVANLLMLCIICSDRIFLGIKALGTKGAAGDPPADPPVDAAFTKEQQEKVNALVQDRLAREREKYKDYEDLKKFKDEHQKQVDAQTQKDLEARKLYDEAKGVYETKIKELSGVISTKDQSILDMRIGHTLNGELSKQNAYLEESLALLKGSVIVDKDGNLFIKGKDANNLDVNLTLEEGVKQFLTKRPHLVKANARPGAGTQPAGIAAEAGVEDLMTLNAEYIKAQTSGDIKRARELRTKIQGLLTAKGVNRNV